MTSPEQLKALTTKRGQIRRKITQFITYLNKFELSGNADYFELDERLNKAEQTWELFDEVQSQIELIDDTQVSERDTFEDQYYSVISRAKALCSQDPRRNVSNVNIQAKSSSQSGDSQNTVANSSTKSQVHLPSLDLPTFSGAYEQWFGFVDTFSALVDSNQDLAKVQKFYYLQCSLKGEAAQAIKAIDVTEINYDLAWDILRERFENKRLIVDKHIQSIINLTPIKHESASLMRIFFDTLQKSVRSLNSLGQLVDTWDTLLIFICVQKLDLHSRKEWEIMNPDRNQFPTFDRFLGFLSKRCQLLEKIDSDFTKQHKVKDEKYTTKNYLGLQGSVICSFCRNNHFNNQCETFLSWPVDRRFNEVKRLGLCTNCIRPGHTNKQCKSTYSCKTCKKRHSSFLHLNENKSTEHTEHINNNVDNSNINTQTPPHTYLITENNANSNTNLHLHEFSNGKQNLETKIFNNHANINTNNSKIIQTVLPTAIINILDNFGKIHECRALLDSGSQSSFITEELVSKLKLKNYKLSLPITGINQTCKLIKNQCKATIQSQFNAYSKFMSFLVIDKIAGEIPQTSFNLSCIDIPNVKLADPEFYKPGRIDVLLGVEVFYELLCIGQVKAHPNGPIFQKTKFGWIAAGQMPSHSLMSNSVCKLSIIKQDSNQMLRDQIELFWKTEELAFPRKLSSEQQSCEQHFINNYTRNLDGRFSVGLPVRNNINQIGNTKDIAIRRFQNLERKLSHNSVLKSHYVKFMQEYLDMGHMTEIKDTDIDDEQALRVYLPHHAVIRESSETTKLRCVFDASCKSDNGISLNDCLMTGPVVQDELFDIILRFRTFNYVFVADLCKMYRQIEVHKDQRNLQTIVWRDDSSESIKHFELNTLTYGTASASFLATRTLVEIANLNQSKYPEACEMIKSSFYVDDLMGGAQTLQDAKRIKGELTSIMASAQFELRKWNSNDKRILLDSNLVDMPEHYIAENEDSKVLGLLWNSNLDTLQYKYQPSESRNSRKISKRYILSSISKIFDPLGLIGPSTIRAKIIMQKLWESGSGWDESVSQDVFNAWNDFEAKLHCLSHIRVSRQVTISTYIDIQLHGFCDASTKAYGAVVYIRAVDSNGSCFIKILCAKSRVAPLKTISLPRLELSSAVLLARLAKRINDTLNITFSSITLWSDSTIALAWIASEPNLYKTFVANRITEIQELTPNCSWRHVDSNSNPADVISRGISPDLLEECNLWWHGPDWLSSNLDLWPRKFNESEVTNINILEKRPLKQFTFVSVMKFDIFKNYSSITKLNRVFAYCMRFINNVRCRKEARMHGNLNVTELETSLKILIKIVQLEEFEKEIHCLENKVSISRKSKLLPLSPFLDNEKILRVGGRINNSSFDFEQRHPILLPAKHIFSELLVKYQHSKVLHAGVQTVLFTLRNKYWIIHGKNLVKKVVRQCVTCFKVNPKSVLQPMGNLPEVRLKPIRPFLNCGTDFAGPFMIKDGTLRSRKSVKVYVCVFICFASKAVHLELAGDLTSETFLNVLKRFIARRGICKNIYSDNGLNFVGADKILKKQFTTVFDFSSDDNCIRDYLSENAITWHRIPAKSPSMGGLWEAAVKQFKHIFKRIIGKSLLHFEQMYTLLTQIEAVINSRPITPISNDPNDFQALSPSHFLIGDILTSPPEEDLSNLALNRLTSYRLLTQMRQHFWRRWSVDYINCLQARTKWLFQEACNIPVNTLVILKEDNLPPLLWKMGRITEVHPGADGIVRVVSVTTTSGVLKRSVRSICILPIYQEEQVPDVDISVESVKAGGM